jgi:hypothetical protein
MTDYHVTVTFTEPPETTEGFIDRPDFFSKLVENLKPFAERRLPDQILDPPIDGVIYNVYVSIDDPTEVPVPHGHPAPTDGSEAAAIVVERALLDLGFTHDRAAVDRGSVAEVGM